MQSAYPPFTPVIQSTLITSATMPRTSPLVGLSAAKRWVVCATMLSKCTGYRRTCHPAHAHVVLFLCLLGITPPKPLLSPGPRYTYLYPLFPYHPCCVQNSQARLLRRHTALRGTRPVDPATGLPLAPLDEGGIAAQQAFMGPRALPWCSNCTWRATPETNVPPGTVPQSAYSSCPLCGGRLRYRPPASLDAETHLVSDVDMLVSFSQTSNSARSALIREFVAFLSRRYRIPEKPPASRCVPPGTPWLQPSSPPHTETDRPEWELAVLTSACPRDVAEFLMTKNATGQTQVHNPGCRAAAMGTFARGTSPCSCPYMQSAATLDRNVALLRGAFNRAGISSPWNELVHHGNPVNSALVRGVLEGLQHFQAERGVRPKRAPLINQNYTLRLLRGVVGAARDCLRTPRRDAWLDASRHLRFALLLSCMWYLGLRFKDALRLEHAAFHLPQGFPDSTYGLGDLSLYLPELSSSQPSRPQDTGGRAAANAQPPGLSSFERVFAFRPQGFCPPAGFESMGMVTLSRTKTRKTPKHLCDVYFPPAPMTRLASLPLEGAPYTRATGASAPGKPYDVTVDGTPSPSPLTPLSPSREMLTPELLSPPAVWKALARTLLALSPAGTPALQQARPATPGSSRSRMASSPPTGTGQPPPGLVAPPVFHDPFHGEAGGRGSPLLTAAKATTLLRGWCGSLGLQTCTLHSFHASASQYAAADPLGTSVAGATEAEPLPAPNTRAALSPADTGTAPALPSAPASRHPGTSPGATQRALLAMHWSPGTQRYYHSPKRRSAPLGPDPRTAGPSAPFVPVIRPQGPESHKE